MRSEGWERLLAEHIEQAYGEPFVWGEHDCVLWCGEWVMKCTGQDYISGIKGTYKTERGAARLLRSRGFKTPESVADAYLTEIPVRLARRGDIVLHPESPTLGISSGLLSFFVTQDSLTSISTLLCPRAWKV